MAIPPSDKFYRPVLEIVAENGATMSYPKLIETLTKYLSLTEQDIQDRVPSGGMTRVYDRAAWAVNKLKYAGLLDSPRRGAFCINSKGRVFLKTHKGDISNKQMQELALVNQSKSDEYPSMPSANHINSGTERNAESSELNDLTPSELMSSTYNRLEALLADEMLENLKSVDPYRFERLVVDLLEKMGYGKGRQIGGSGDGGIDGIINQDPLGLEKVYIQAKRYDTAQVGEPPIRNFAGSLVAKGASKGVFITTSNFSSPAQQTAQNISAGNQFIRLIDGLELSRLMITHDVGVVPETTYVIKKLDENYFADDI